MIVLGKYAYSGAGYTIKQAQRMLKILLLTEQTRCDISNDRYIVN